MKITNEVVGALNAGLSDLYFEFGVLTNLVEFELMNGSVREYDKTDLLKRVEEIDFLSQEIKKIVTEASENPSDLQMRDMVEMEGKIDALSLSETENAELELFNRAKKLISSLAEIGVSGEEELRTMLSKKLSTEKDNASIDKGITDLRSKAATIIQADKVVEGLGQLGLSEKAKKEIDKIKNKELTKLMDVLLVKVQE